MREVGVHHRPLLWAKDQGINKKKARETLHKKKGNGQKEKTGKAI